MVPRLLLICAFLSSFIPSACAFVHHQDTGFLNRRIVTNGAEHKYMVYLPEGWNPHELWPIILFLHGSGERGSEGMTVLECGCAYTDSPSRWAQMCRTHGEPTEALHIQARIDHERNDAIRELTS